MTTLKLTDSDRELLSSFMGKEYGESIDWNGIMEIVDRIEDLSSPELFYVHIVGSVCLIGNGFGKERDNFIDVPANSKIQATLTGITTFITWYNTNNQNNGTQIQPEPRG